MMGQSVSVIIPVYNVEQYLPGCIESVLHQTYNELEILLIDDGSTDRSGEICDRYALKDSRIRVIHQENKGQSEARNNGLEYAKNDYLFFLDSDDYLAPKTIETLVYYAQIENADIVSCQFVMTDKKYFDNDNLTEQQEKCYIKSVLTEEEAVNEFFISINKVYTGKVVWEDAHVKANVCDKLFRAKIFDKIRFPSGKICEDLWIVCDLLKNADRIVITNYPGYFYFQRQGSTMHSIKYDISINDIEAYMKYYKQEKIIGNKTEISLILLRLCLQKYRNIKHYGGEKEKVDYIRKIVRLHWKHAIGKAPYKEVVVWFLIAYCPQIYDGKFL